MKMNPPPSTGSNVDESSGYIKPVGFELWRKHLAPEKNFIFVSFIYACAISLLSLAIPISVQALVNTVTFAVLMQPLIVVSLLLLALLVFSGILRGLQDYAIEYLQRHFYARKTLEIGYLLIDATEESLSRLYRGDLVNRYFDIMIVQKKMAKLLVGGFSLLLQTIVGMLLLAFYHPYFLAFDIVLVTLLTMVWVFYGPKALDSATYESKAKYKVAAWLEQLANYNKLFKTTHGKAEAVEKTDKNVRLYLERRAIHFSFLFKQIIFLLGIYALMSALILGLGGFLVIEGQLTLGQLVAAEIVVAVILSGFAKAGAYLESAYDMHASLDKLCDFYKLELESNDGIKDLGTDPLDLSFEKASVKRHGRSYTFNAFFEASNAYLLKEDYDSTQRVFLGLIHGDRVPRRGRVKLGRFDLTQIAPEALRAQIFLIEETRILEGTVRENLCWGGLNPSEAEINEACDKVGLTEVFESFPGGKATKLWPGTSLLCWGEMVRLELARALIIKPSWVVISSMFFELPGSLQKDIISHFKEKGIGLLVWSAGAEGVPPGFDGEVNFKRDEDGKMEVTL